MALLMTGCNETPKSEPPSATTSSMTLSVSSSPKTSTTTVEVYINSEARQCEYSGHTLQRTQQVLVNQGVNVVDSACGVLTAMMFPTVCGGRTGKINIHTIAAGDLPRAEDAGFKTTLSLALGKDPGYQIVKCDKRGVNFGDDT